MIENDELNKVPQTDDDVIAHFNALGDKFLASCIIGLYECYRGMGEDVLTAYEHALRSAIDSMMEKK